MASIQTKGNVQYLVYENPFNVLKKRDQIWDKISEDKDPNVVLAEFNLRKVKGTLIPPNKLTVNAFTDQFISFYGPLTGLLELLTPMSV